MAPNEDDPAGGTRRWLEPLALFAAALAVRAVAWREVWGATVVPVGSDAFYHLRRIVFAVFRHPERLDFDPYINFPDGARPIWTPLFDGAVAAMVRPWVPPLGQGGQAAVELLAVWVPPLLGALCVTASYGLATRHYGRPTGLVAGISLTLFSGHYWYSQIGFVDHHAAVALLATLLLAAALELVAAHERRAWVRRLVCSLLVGALAAACLLLWPGCLLHVGLVELALVGLLLWQAEALQARRLALALAAGHALALALVAPAGIANDWPQWGAFSPVVLSRFQPWLFAFAVGVTGGCALLWQRSELGVTRARRALVFLLLVVLGLLASAVLAPELRDGARDAWDWLAKEDAFQARVAESQPLFLDAGRFTLAIAVERLSPFVLVFPVALVLVLRRQRARSVWTRSLVLALWSTGLLAVTLLQKRFFNTASVGVALVLGLAFAELWRAAGVGRAATRWRLASLLGLAACLLPTVPHYVRPLANEWRALRGERLEVTGAYAAVRAVVELSGWLRTGTPPTRGWLRDDLVPEYGVLAPWPHGHAIEYVGRRPTLVDNFGDDLGAEGLAFADRFYASPEADVAQQAAQRGVRYVVVQRGAGFLGRRPGPDALARVLFPADAARPGPEGRRVLPPLERHRLVFESSGLVWSDREAEPVFRVFELVPGAVVSGRAAPGAAVELRLGVSSQRGRRFFYERRVVADADGVYRARVPYATRGGPDGVQVSPLYRLKCGDEVRGVEVSEAAVHAGELVPAPPVCSEAPKLPSPEA